MKSDTALNCLTHSLHGQTLFKFGWVRIGLVCQGYLKMRCIDLERLCKLGFVRIVMVKCLASHLAWFSGERWKSGGRYLKYIECRS